MMPNPTNINFQKITKKQCLMNAIWLIEQQQFINEQIRTGSDERIRTKMLKSDLERRVKKYTRRPGVAMRRQEEEEWKSV